VTTPGPSVPVPPERWLPVPGWENLYEVSSHGQVESHHRATPRILRPGYMKKSGYAVVGLNENGVQVTRTVHSLVLEAFAGPPGPGQEARHLDGNPANNRWAPGNEEEARAAGGNLVYGTSGQNNLDQVAHGTHNKASRKKCAQGHRYTPENTVLVCNPDGSVRQRACRECQKSRSARFREMESDAPLSDEDRCTDEEGCDRRKVARGLCRKHYARAWRAEREQEDAA
jgi:NUMOD4 motif